ncbi:hypothetical protein EJ419_02120 [Alloscardovia theropitheci]|uniref:Uncharacterized protein n=1 Tax=Alloscardovia theropitheci TaxID=2496842 RepID=A0A4R0QQP6_9BIFI|nr:hypothetical protein [Alloscardovia theropitheci]TCD54652.1 hypothetical protein EJ419_02120 [Alloscardovia theropitheci]
MSDFVVNDAELRKLKTDIQSAKQNLSDMTDIDISAGKIEHPDVEKALSDFLDGVKLHKKNITKGVEVWLPQLITLLIIRIKHILKWQVLSKDQVRKNKYEECPVHVNDSTTME